MILFSPYLDYLSIQLDIHPRSMTSCRNVPFKTFRINIFAFNILGKVSAQTPLSCYVNLFFPNGVGLKRCGLRWFWENTTLFPRIKNAMLRECEINPKKPIWGHKNVFPTMFAMWFNNDEKCWDLWGDFGWETEDGLVLS